MKKLPQHLKKIGEPAKIKLFHEGKFIAWMDLEADNWCVVGDTLDADVFAVTPYLYAKDNKTYYATTINNDLRWLSVNADGRVGFYRWINATAWNYASPYLISEYNGGKVGTNGLSMLKNIKTNNYSKVLEIVFEPLTVE